MFSRWKRRQEEKERRLIAERTLYRVENRRYSVLQQIGREHPTSPNMRELIDEHTFLCKVYDSVKDPDKNNDMTAIFNIFAIADSVEHQASEIAAKSVIYHPDAVHTRERVKRLAKENIPMSSEYEELLDRLAETMEALERAKFEYSGADAATWPYCMCEDRRITYDHDTGSYVSRCCDRPTWRTPRWELVTSEEYRNWLPD